MIGFSVQLNFGSLSQLNRGEQTAGKNTGGIDFLQSMSKVVKENVSNFITVPGNNRTRSSNFRIRQHTEKFGKPGKWTTVYDLIAEIERFGERAQRRK